MKKVLTFLTVLLYAGAILKHEEILPQRKGQPLMTKINVVIIPVIISINVVPHADAVIG
ncbi:hypothetical protein FC50_GL001950 [Lacticaseibacillus pantheris DSM 15945 = JCM 12539 = NBRC 106106]|uniref:Uncharacterized protein n=1 Tax=Lacticaseibacillus pantheris DSM 15945 = JCM 12539 = NBRC 106106 TaxID=1423783 RepID=A0A0R1TTL0_9LACO|nr:hypothetical protein [Lacticaseibacillus pantheris]KRL84641.1 hypothetical protein FC50_GL001950 [Lacticaseibacillus pantheris DSM 15945 = JCM 12539 = NBRC 106106]